MVLSIFVEVAIHHSIDFVDMKEQERRRESYQHEALVLPHNHNLLLEVENDAVFLLFAHSRREVWFVVEEESDEGNKDSANESKDKEGVLN